MAYIQNELIPADGIATTFTLTEAFKEGTVLVIINDKLTYEFYEVENSGNPPVDITFHRAPAADAEVYASYYPASEQNTLNAVRYATPAQAKTLSRVTDFVALTDVAMDQLIREAELMIDQYIAYPYRGYHGNKGQRLKFPRFKDEVKFYDSDRNVSDYVGIPQDVTMATVFAAENLFLIGDVKADGGVGDITSERLGDYQYTRSGGLSDSASNSAAKLIGKRSRAIVDKYRRMTRTSKIGAQYDDDQLMNSRQRFARDHY